MIMQLYSLVSEGRTFSGGNRGLWNASHLTNYNYSISILVRKINRIFSSQETAYVKYTFGNGYGYFAL